MMICSPCVPSLAAMHKVFSFNDQPESIRVCFLHGIRAYTQT